MLAFLMLGRERLRSYSVHERPNPAADRVDRAEALEFVKDGFNASAFLAPPVWLASHGVWVGLLSYLAAIALILTATAVFALPPLLPVLAIIAVHLIFGNEADEMIRAQYTAKGWTTVGHVTGTGTLDCERRFFDTWLPAEPLNRNRMVMPAVAVETRITPQTVQNAPPVVAPMRPTGLRSLLGKLSKSQTT
jgi:Protein of unknown function (DUF2628)